MPSSCLSLASFLRSHPGHPAALSLLLLVSACDGASEQPTAQDATFRMIDAASDADGASDASALDAAPADAAGATPRDATLLVPCTAVAPTACPDPAPSYAQVAAVIEQRCAVCHSPMWTGPWPLDNYQHVADWQDDIRSNLVNCTMPPPDAESPLPEAESALILAWLRCGLPM